MKRKVIAIVAISVVMIVVALTGIFVGKIINKEGIDKSVEEKIKEEYGEETYKYVKEHVEWLKTTYGMNFELTDYDYYFYSMGFNAGEHEHFRFKPIEGFDIHENHDTGYNVDQGLNITNIAKAKELKKYVEKSICLKCD